MPTPATSDLPKPKSWDEFEDIVWDIYIRKLQDTHAQRYGRSGQQQHGVDIYGQQHGSCIYTAIQCKRYEDKKLNTETIVTELIKVNSFTSPINEYIIATTASRDKNVQDTVRYLNVERQSEGKFLVYIVFWEDICSYLAEPSNFDLLKKYYCGWENVFLCQNQLEEQKLTSIKYLLALDIQKDCLLLQELLEHDEKTYLSEKWQYCLSRNRDIWQNIEFRLLLTQHNSSLVQSIQNFYQHLDFIEDSCKSLLGIKEKILPFELKKQKYVGTIRFDDNMNPPPWTKNLFTEADAISLLNGKKVTAMRFIKLKEKIKTTFELGNQIASALSMSISTSGEG
ncbi:restriction endonuclease [Dolichospermum sp. UHCC 0684]|jgi:hypothetical protein|uniref:restriction endonuclease n=2 Tax=Cyanophyceae TaxID=3028117 RepID=UPI001445D074|nr:MULTISPECIES: restriction endonuclease [unclassified Dolichospermum]MBO1057170.1 hypothetical protein [Dolichospermum sp. JUN01]MEA5531845.1 restriction endonuclease [Dolichospermum sp. UHCC 0684]MTJ34317.1 hypothetical protein [Dolichospermum sp. UHCC 0260]